MPVFLSCPTCGKQLQVSESATGKMVRCPNCKGTFRATSQLSAAIADASPLTADADDVALELLIGGTPPEGKQSHPRTNAAADSAVAASAAQSAAPPKKTLAITAPISLKMKVNDDSAQQWSGDFEAELTSDAFVLKDVPDCGDVSIPYGIAAEVAADAYVRISWEGRIVTFSVLHKGVDRVRMARDLVEVLSARRRFFQIDAYRLPAYLPLLAILPLICPAVIAYHVASNNLTLPNDWVKFAAENWMTLGWTFLCVCAMGLLLLWSRSGIPSVATRLVCAAILALTCNVVPGAVYTWQSVDVAAYLPASGPIPDGDWMEYKDPDQRYRVDFPGAVTSNKDRLPGAHEVTMTGIDLGSSGFFVLFLDVPEREWQRVPLHERFTAARDGAIKKSPNARVVSEIDINRDGHPGKEVLINIRNHGNVVMWVVAVENRIYILTGAGRGYTRDSADVKRFLESFTVAPAPPRK